MITETIERAKDVLRYPRNVRSRAGKGDSKQIFGRRFHKALVESSLGVDQDANYGKYVVNASSYETYTSKLSSC